MIIFVTNILHLVVILCFGTKQITAGCREDAVAIGGNYVIIASNEKTDAVSAAARCTKSGGSLAKVTDEATKTKLLTFLENKYTSANLDQVNIFRNPNNANNFKYRPILTSSGDTTSLSSWIRPTSPGQLSSIKLYKQGSTLATEKVSFCWISGRDQIRLCNQGWNLNFDLYGITPSSSESVKIFNNLYNVANSFSSRLSLEVLKIANYELFGDFPFFYIPDISVFIGAQSNIHQTKWFWNDGTMITDSNYPASDISTCQQMTWPLTYNDNKNLAPKQCSVYQAYYLCQYKFDITANATFACSKGNSLKISWKSEFYESHRAYFDGTVKIEIIEAGRSLVVQYTSTPYIVKNLFPTTTYTVKVTVASTQCPTLSASTTINQFTQSCSSSISYEMLIPSVSYATSGTSLGPVTLATSSLRSHPTITTTAAAAPPPTVITVSLIVTGSILLIVSIITGGFIFYKKMSLKNNFGHHDVRIPANKTSTINSKNVQQAEDPVYETIKQTSLYESPISIDPNGNINSGYIEFETKYENFNELMGPKVA